MMGSGAYPLRRRVAAAISVFLLSVALPAAAAQPSDLGATAQPSEAPPEPAATARPSDSPSGPSASVEPPAGEVLCIDNMDIFAGMDSAYQSGYLPTVTDSIARVVLPLLSAHPVKNERILVSVNLGDPAASPFLFRNYDQTVHLLEHDVNGGAKKVDAYLVDLALELAPSRVPGTYPVTLTATGLTENGEAFVQAFTVFVTIPGAPEKPRVPADDAGSDATVNDTGGDMSYGGDSSGGAGASVTEPTPSEPAPQPKVLVAAYSATPDPVLAGDTFALSVTLRNTSATEPMRNVKITVNGEGADLLPAGGENSFYFASIPAEKDVALQMQMKVPETAQPGPKRIVVHIDYEGDQRAPYSSDETLAVQIVQPLRVECDAPEIPEHLNAGDTLSVPVNVMDMGRGTVYNVRAQIEASGLSPEGSLFLGNIESGASKKGELYAFVGTLESNLDGDGRYGQTKGTVTVVYEDELGTPSEQVFEFTTYIEPPAIQTPPPEVEEEPQTQSQWQVSALIAGGLIVAAVASVLYRRRRTRKGTNDEGW